METLIKDLRYGVRSFLKRPGFLLIAVSTLALGIGATTAMFTVVNSVLLRPLQFPDPARIVLFRGVNPRQGIRESNMSIPDIADWQQQSQSFEQIAAFVSGGVFLTAGGETERLRVTGVTADFFPLQSTKVVIVNETMARQLWPGESPIGRRFTIWRDEKDPREVVGVVGDTKSSLDKESGQQMYVPYAQDPTWGSLSLIARTSGEPTALAGSVREAIRTVDKAVPNYNLKTMNDVVSTSAAPRRIPMLLLSAFAGVAMLLAMLGIYGVTSYYVTQRRHEIGVRLALGAQVVDVLKLVLRRALLLAAVGVGIGVAGAFALTRYLTTLLFGVKPVDTVTFVAVAVILAAVVFVACLIPARRAAKGDPLEALR